MVLRTLILAATLALAACSSGPCDDASSDRAGQAAFDTFCRAPKDEGR